MRADHTTNNPLTYCTRVRVRVQAVHVRKYFRTALKYLFPDVFYVFISGSTKVRKYESTKVRKYESTFVPSKVLFMSTVPYEDIDCSRTFLM